MDEAKRTKKRVIAFLALALIFFVLILVFYLILKDNPTCNDNIQNQRETGVDCGGPCFPCPEKIEILPLELVRAEFVHFSGNKYDVLVQVKNHNNILGAENGSIAVRLLGENKKVLAEKNYQDAFILPEEEKYISVYGLETSEIPVEAEAIIGEIKWEKFSQYKEPRLLVINKFYEKSAGGSAFFSQAKGTLINKSEIDYEEIKVSVILRDASEKLLAVNSQIMNTVRSGEQRDFVASFSESFPGDVAKVEVQPETNVFDSENYIKTYGQPENWNQ